MANGDINNVAIITPNKKITAKKIAPPIDDPRNDLLKAIRDGNSVFFNYFKIDSFNLFYI